MTGRLHMEKKNRRIEMTKNLIKQALFELLKTKDIYKISVKELCDKADVNRTTFYAHYSQPEDVLTEVEDECIAKLVTYLEKISPNVSTKEYLVEFFRTIKENKEIYRTILKSGSGFFFEKLRKVYLHSTDLLLDRTDYPEYFKEFLICGNIAILVKWIKDDCSIDIDRIANLMFNVNRKVIP